MSKSKYTRTLALFHEQKGLCWICNVPMSPPILRDVTSSHQHPHKFEATLDHLVEKNIINFGSNPRPAKAAHGSCNSARHHYSIDSIKVIKIIKHIQKLLSESRINIKESVYTKEIKYNMMKNGKHHIKNVKRKNRRKKAKALTQGKYHAQPTTTN